MKVTRSVCIWILAVVFGCGLLGAEAASAFQVGDLKVGGAIRVNYIYGDYDDDGTGRAQRGDNDGNFEFDTFRVNLDYQRDNLLGKVEYRFYDGYHFLHTGWLGYQLTPESQIQAGVNRVPFGVGPYGPSNNYFFDQHYYVGLSDDMDLGVKYMTRFGNLKLDLAYYAMPEPNGRGDSDHSDRYSYDMVHETDDPTGYSAYEEEHQFNLRAVYSLFRGSSLPTDLGVSLQYGLLDAKEDYADDTDAYAGSIHSKTTWGNWALMLQLTKYKYDADFDDPSYSNDLIGMGAFIWSTPVASEGTIPSVALAYTWANPVSFIDSITFYNDYSIIVKEGEDAAGNDLNDSEMNVTGMAIASGGWYIYVDYVWSDGNYFVGSSDGDEFGSNQNDDWQYRFNVNFGYYF